jgi:hypothetical protein
MFLHFRHKVGGADVDKIPSGERDQKCNVKIEGCDIG